MPLRILCVVVVAAAATAVSGCSSVPEGMEAASIPELRFLVLPESSDLSLPPETGAPLSLPGEDFASGGQVVAVRWLSPPNTPGGDALEVAFDSDGSAALERVSSEHMRRYMVAVLGDSVVWSAVIIEPITDGELLIQPGSSSMRRQLESAITYE